LALDVFQRHNLVMTSKNAADFVHFVMPEQAPASQNGQSRAKGINIYFFNKILGTFSLKERVNACV
jgi:hypothetical protein